MRATTPKQAIIESITDPDPHMRREARGMLAKPESIVFRKARAHQHIWAYVVSYTSTTNQEWYEASCVMGMTDGFYARQSGFRWKAENRFRADEEMRAKHQQQPWLRASGGSVSRTIVQNASEDMRIQEIREEGVIKHAVRIGALSLLEPGGEVSEYYLLVGTLVANGWDVARVRMIPDVGVEEEDEVQDSMVLFLNTFAPPLTFEFYSSAPMLIARQRWEG